MKLSKPMIIIFKEIIHGSNTINDLKLNRSFSWTASIITDLEKEGFIIKKKEFNLKGSRKIINVSGTNYSLKLKDLMFKYPTVKFEEIFSDSKLRFLMALEDWITIKEASNLSNVSTHMILRYMKKLQNRGIIEKNKSTYRINQKSWPLLREFILEYRNYSTLNGYIKWKYDEEIIFEVDKKELVKGEITGLNKYKEYGINVRTISSLCLLPKKKVSKEEVFIHSLFEINDSRTKSLALTYHIKNKLKKNKVLPIAMRYGKYTQYEDLLNLLNGKVTSMFDKKEFVRIAKMYGVKDV